MANVNDILRSKGSAVHGVAPTATVYEAIERMVARNVGALVVRDGDRPCGIVTERDYLRRIAIEGRTSKATKVEAIMSTELVSVTPDTSVERCMTLMTEKRVRHLPVISGGHLKGMVSIGDVVKHLLRDKEDHIQHLTDYIQGRA
jgi:CBS domain-containing protein